MRCDDASSETRSSLAVRIGGDSRDPGSTPCAFADLIQDFQTTPSVGGLVRPSTTAKTPSIWWVFALSIRGPKAPNEIALAAEPLIRSASVDKCRSICGFSAWPSNSRGRREWILYGKSASAKGECWRGVD